MAIITKGITLGYAASKEGPFSTLTNLQEIPEIGNAAPEKIDVTTLTDNVKTYVAGLGDSGQDLAFKFIYEKEQFQTLMAIKESQYWQVSMPDSVTATFKGTPSVKFDSASPNAALTYTLSVLVESEIEFGAGA